MLIDGYDKTCDWWSFGAVLYEMLTGAPPFFSNNRKEIIRKIVYVKITLFFTISTIYHCPIM